jgi:chromosome partitioning protein
MSTRPVELGLVDLTALRIARLLDDRDDRREEEVAEGEATVRVIAFLNGKGGVGKSSSAAAISAALAEQGMRVLHAELDPQGNNAEDLGYNGGALYDDGRSQAEAVLNGRAFAPTGEARPGLYVVPGGQALEEVTEELYCQRRLARQTGDPAWLAMYVASIEQALDELDIDIVVLDVAPGSSVLQLQALVAADAVIVPSRSDPSSRKGLRVVAQRFTEAREYNNYLHLLGVLLFATGTSSVRVRKEIRKQLEGDLGGHAPVFQTAIRYVEAAAMQCRQRGLTPEELAKTDEPLDRAIRASADNLAVDYRSLLTEVLTGLSQRRRQLNEEAASARESAEASA